jgi:siroheme synthase-like protein
VAEGLYPVMLDLRAVPVLVVGAGRVGARKVASLAAAGAAVTVVAPDVAPDAVARAARVERRPYRCGDIDGHRLVVTATGRPDVDAAVHADATAAGVWVNAADDPEHCSFLLPAVLRRGPVVVAVSTSGRSPALASWLRDAIAETVGEDVGMAAEALAARRGEFRRAGVSTESVPWADAVDAALADARRRLRQDSNLRPSD